MHLHTCTVANLVVYSVCAARCLENDACFDAFSSSVLIELYYKATELRRFVVPGILVPLQCNTHLSRQHTALKLKFSNVVIYLGG